MCLVTRCIILKYIFVIVVTATSSNHQQSNSGLNTLKLWKDGFTINDSELRLYTDPENREFLETIRRGEIPPEIRQEIQGTEARLDMEDHHHETYVPPKAKVKAFSGKGHMLGRYIIHILYIKIIIYI